MVADVRATKMISESISVQPARRAAKAAGPVCGFSGGDALTSMSVCQSVNLHKSRQPSDLTRRR